jgi:hypothetical protein
LYQKTRNGERYFISLDEATKGLIAISLPTSRRRKYFVSMINPLTDEIVDIFDKQAVEVDLKTFQQAFELASIGKVEDVYQLGREKVLNPTPKPKPKPKKPPEQKSFMGEIKKEIKNSIPENNWYKAIIICSVLILSFAFFKSYYDDRASATKVTKETLAEYLEIDITDVPKPLQIYKVKAEDLMPIQYIS